MGKWTPSEGNGTQRDQILDCLKKLQVATIDQIHEETGIPRKSLYEQLSRLQTSELPDEKVLKEGTRRKYTYRLALFNTIQQLNSVLNSAYPDSDGNRGAMQQKITFSSEGDHPESDHPTHAKDDHFAGSPPPPTNPDIVEYTPSNQDRESVSPIQQRLKK